MAAKKLDTRNNPQATELTPYLDNGGLGAHSQDELQTILAGHTVGTSFFAGDETFISSVRTTPRDLKLQFQLLTAFITDPGYRNEG